MAIENEGSSTNITLFFKHGRLTILVLSEPSTKLSTLKDELLSALRDRYPNGLPNPTSILPPNLFSSSSANSVTNIPVPASIDDVVLGVPKDENDLTQGWEELGLNGGTGRGFVDIPRGLGLKDGSLIAFRFRKADAEEEADSAEDSRFEVVLPSYDENYEEEDPRQLADDEMEDNEDEVDDIDEDEDEYRRA